MIKKERFYFTLIELLIVITIIAILFSLMIPSLKKSRDVAYLVVCLNNTKNIFKSTILYSVDNKGYIPAGASHNKKLTWDDYLGSYDGRKLKESEAERQGGVLEDLPGNKLYYCPRSAERFGSGFTQKSGNKFTRTYAINNGSSSLSTDGMANHFKGEGKSTWKIKLQQVEDSSGTMLYGERKWGKVGSFGSYNTHKVEGEGSSSHAAHGPDKGTVTFVDGSARPVNYKSIGHNMWTRQKGD